MHICIFNIYIFLQKTLIHITIPEIMETKIPNTMSSNPIQQYIERIMCYNPVHLIPAM